jgi:hypothetical protein
MATPRLNLHLLLVNLLVGLQGQLHRLHLKANPMNSKLHSKDASQRAKQF